MLGDAAVRWLAFAALNLLLAALVVSLRPRREVNPPLAALFAANGAASLARALGELAPGAAPWTLVATLAEAPTFLLLGLIPLVFPRRRLGPRAHATLLAGAAAILIATCTMHVARHVAPGGPADEFVWEFFLVNVPLLAGVCAGVLLFLDERVAGASPLWREQATFLLAAYVLKAATMTTSLPEAMDLRVVRQDTWLNYAFGWIWDPLLWILVLAPLLTIAVGTARGRGLASRMDLLVVGLALLGVAFARLRVAPEIEYLVIRPVLFAYGILRLQLLDVDVRERRGIVAAAIVAGAVSLLLGTASALEAFGWSGGAALGAGLALGLASAAALGFPLARAMLGLPGGLRARPSDLYLAALHEAAARPPGDAATASGLAALRARLGISEEEHALLASGLARRGAAGPRAGEIFLGRYEVRALLGEGAQAQTFVAFDREARRTVVLKVPRAPGPREIARLAREARALQRLDHPRIVRVQGVHELEAGFVLVLEHVRGGSLARRLETSGALPPVEAIALADDVLAALEAAHAAGLVHRDVKPANVLLAEDGAKLADFGVARTLVGSGTLRSTGGDGVVGTLASMAPEQVRGEEATAASDLYAVGALLYECLAGRGYLRLAGRLDMDVRLAILEEPPLLPLAGAPEGLNALLADALAKDPAARPASASAMRDRLRKAYLRGPK